VHFRFLDQDAPKTPADVLAVGAGTDYRTDLAALDALFGGQLLSWAEARDFKPKAGKTLVIPSMGRVAARDLILVGIGDGSEANLRKAAARAGREARSLNAASLALALEPSSTQVGASLAAGAAIGNYQYEKYKAEDERTAPLETITVLGLPDNAETQALATRTEILVRNQFLTRDLVNGPPAEVYPATLAASAESLAHIDNLTVEVWDFERCRAEDCVGIVAVGQGSSEPGCLIHMSYRPPNAKAHVALVGKGVTFDAGGLSIKPTGGMLTMRCDMGGAGTVIGAMGAAAELGIPVAIDAYIGAVENMISGNSYKLGDILTYRNGVTVEIHNTDAEGRLVLADCLINACKVEGVTHIVDYATLTGACVVALGSDFTALFTHDEGLAKGLLDASDDIGEGLWRMPLHNGYADHLKSDYASIKNVGGREAGATTAALFLKNFVTDDVAWAHLDIAGSAFHNKASSTWAAGATGQMVRTTIQWLESLVSDS